MKTNNPNKRFLRNDFLLIGAILLVCAIGAVYLFCFRERGNTVTVTVDGKPYGTYALSQDLCEDIVADGKEGCNRLIVQNGKAYIETASCPDGICVSHAPIFRNGESIICLPNRVVVTVTTEHGADDPDIVV